MGLKGRIAKILSFTRTVRNGARVSDVKVDPGGGANITAEHFAPAGDDSHPLNTDYSYAAPVENTGRRVIVGYLDPKNTPKAELGDKRIYGRDPSTGVAVVEVWLKNDGTAVISNGTGTMELQPNGTFNINGVTIDITGAIVTPTSIISPSVIANSKELAEHTHPAGTPPGDTGVNN